MKNKVKVLEDIQSSFMTPAQMKALEAVEPAVRPSSAVRMPTVCRIVQYRGLATETHGGQDWHPAMITRVYGDDPHSPVNLKVFFDTASVENRMSIEHESKRGPRAWRWPQR